MGAQQRGPGRGGPGGLPGGSDGCAVWIQKELTKEMGW